MTNDKMTPEQHHDRLVEAIEHELSEYGPRSLAAIIATILEENDSAWSAKYAPLFRQIEEAN